MGNNLKNLTISELNKLKEDVAIEIIKRSENPEDYIKVIYIDDGSEGVYCPSDLFHKVPAHDLKEYIATILNMGGNIEFNLAKFRKTDYQRDYAQYEWQFGDGSNTPVIEDE